MALPPALITGLKYAGPIIAQAGLNYFTQSSAQRDAERRQKQQEDEQRMLNAIAAFRRAAPQQAVSPRMQYSGRTQGLNLLRQLAPLLYRQDWGDSNGRD